MILALLVAAMSVAASPTVRPLSANSSIRDSLAGGETAVFSIDLPAQSAARVVVRQVGVDVGITLRLAGSNLPEHGLDMVAGLNGEEVRYVAISDAPATWNVFVEATLPRAPRGDFTISLEMRPADDRARAIAAARQLYQNASDLDWLGTTEKTKMMYTTVAEQPLALGDQELAAEAVYQTGRRHDVLGDVPGAIEWQQGALVLFREIGCRDRESRVLNRLGDLSRKVGAIRDSEQYFQQALPIAGQTGDRINEADILNNSGLLMLSVGRLEEALDQLQAAIPLAQELGSANVEVALWGNSAECYLRLGMNEKSIEAYERAVARVRNSDLPARRVGRSLHRLAMMYFENGDRGRAHAAMREALELLEKSHDVAYTAEAIGFLGRMQHANGEDDRAVESFARALPVLRQAKNSFAQATVLATWAEVDIDRGHFDAALEKLEEALAFTRQVAGRGIEANTLYLRAVALQKKEKLDEAIDSISAAIEIVETKRGAIVRSELRTSYLAAVRRYYDLYIDLLQQRGQTSAAFAVSESARARTLLESLAESGAKIRKGVDPALLKLERAVQAELNAKDVYRAQVVLKEGENSPRAVALSTHVGRLLDEWKNIQAKIRVSSPAYAELKMPEPVTLEHVQKSLLDATNALVAYHVGASRSYAWVVDRESITVRELPVQAKIEPLARRYHELLSREIDSMTGAERGAIAKQIAATGQRIAEAVWKPVAARVRGKRLLIVADGALQYVPFGALPSASGEPLIAQHEIVYLPSASVLDALRRHSRRVPSYVTAAVFADPVFTRNDPRVSGGQTTGEAPVLHRGGPYTRLRFSRKEAEAIVTAAGKQTFEALDFSAAKKTIAERDLRKYRIIHFATHGFLDTEQPELSGLVLSLIDPNGKTIDGFLHLHEIYNLDLDADLVVLSACRTALGKEVHGEGLIGLTRGFMYAGASRVVSSVWNVDDRASAQLMSSFYTAMLSKGLPPAAALREAQLSLLRQPRWSNPHYWAAFGLQGEWK